MKVFKQFSVILLGMLTLFMVGCGKKDNPRVLTWTNGEPEYYDEAKLPRWTDDYPKVEVTYYSVPQDGMDGEIVYYYNPNDYDKVLHDIFNCTCEYDDDDCDDGFFEKMFDRDDDDDHEYCECMEEQMEKMHGDHDDDDDDDYEYEHKCYTAQTMEIKNMELSKGIKLRAGKYRVKVEYKR